MQKSWLHLLELSIALDHVSVHHSPSHGPLHGPLALGLDVAGTDLLVKAHCVKKAPPTALQTVEFPHFNLILYEIFVHWISSNLDKMIYW